MRIGIAPSFGAYQDKCQTPQFKKTVKYISVSIILDQCAMEEGRPKFDQTFLLVLCPEFQYIEREIQFNLLKETSRT